MAHILYVSNTDFTPSSWMENRPEWQFVALAAAAYSLTTTSLYPILGPNVVEYCINHSEAKVNIVQHGPRRDLNM